MWATEPYEPNVITFIMKPHEYHSTNGIRLIETEQPCITITPPTWKERFQKAWKWLRQYL